MKKRYWLRGGIGLLLLYGLLTAILYPFGTGEWFPYWLIPSIIGGIPLSALFHWLSSGIYSGIYSEGLTGFTLPIITYFILGAILGWLYGKIKNRNKI